MEVDETDKGLECKIPLSFESESDSSSFDNSTNQEISEHESAVRNYYISLVKDEHNRLCLVEPSENLGNIITRLEGFLWFSLYIIYF